MSYWEQAGERCRQFHEAHGGEAVMVNGWWFYPDGATRENNPLGLLAEPPQDDLERWDNQKIFHTKRLDESVYQFRELKSQLEGRVKVGGTCSQQELDELRVLKLQVTKCRKALAKVERQIKNHPRIKARHEAKLAAEQQKEQQLSALSDIEI